MEKGYYEIIGKVTGLDVIMVAIHNKNGKGLLHDSHCKSSLIERVAIHNKNGKGLLLDKLYSSGTRSRLVAIHNKNGKGLLQKQKNQEQKMNLIVAIHNKNGKGLLQINLAMSTLKHGRRNPQ